MCPAITGFLGVLYVLTLGLQRFSTHESYNIIDPLISVSKFIFFSITSIILAIRDNIYFREFLLFIMFVFEILVMFKVHNFYVVGRKFKSVKLDGKVFIVTGSNTGIGFETAKELVIMGATVILACRSLDRANVARQSILSTFECAPSKVIVLKLDLCGFDSVKKFIKEFLKLGLPLHCLINNAGLMIQDRNLTQDGFETVFTANHLSHFLLTNLLLPELEKTNEGRVVNVSSSLHKSVSAFNFDDVMSENSYDLFVTYSQSKLANILFTIELQNRLTAKGSKVTCNAVHPGIVRTDVTRNMNALLRYGQAMISPLLYLIHKSPEQGAYCTLHVATSPDLAGIGGKYFVQSEQSTVGAAADADSAKRLWEISEKFTGLKHIN